MRLKLKHCPVAFFVLIGLFFFYLRPIQVQGSSMEPAFFNGEWLWTVPLMGSPERGDCVIFTNPHSGSTSLKRVRALPGDYFITAHKSVGRPLSPLGIHEKVWLNGFAKKADFFGTTLPKNAFYLLGDNEVSSFDSRFYGPISKNYIKRKVVGARNSMFFETDSM